MVKVFDYCYNKVPVNAQKEFRRLMFEHDNGSVAFMDSFYSLNVLESKKQEAISNT